MTKPQESPGRLVVVGIGIALEQTTLEAKAEIESADRVFYLTSAPLATHWILALNSAAESLYKHYRQGVSRRTAYDGMVEEIIGAVRAGDHVCAAFYGHPGIFVDPSHRAVRLAREEGFPARMAAGVSAEDYLFAELLVDPSRFGCSSYEATDFLIYDRPFSTTSTLVLWQVGVIGDVSYQYESDPSAGLAMLLERLVPAYGAHHEVTVFEGSTYPITSSRIETFALGDLSSRRLTSISTLYVPPLRQANPNLDVVRRLGLADHFGTEGRSLPSKR